MAASGLNPCENVNLSNSLFLFVFRRKCNILSMHVDKMEL